MTTTRAGRWVKQVEGYRAFIPAALPPDPPVAMDAEMVRLLSDADRALGRLDGATAILPNPDLFVTMYVRQEAVLSSQIEGTQSTLEDVLQYELHKKSRRNPLDVAEVSNYVRAMDHGLQRLDKLPLSLRLIREIHEILLEGRRGSDRTPGEFRTSQNWIGPEGATLSGATFVPPPVHEMHTALSRFERFLHDQQSLPVLLHCGLAHAQFETIHPFLDGNGRVGRLLTTFLLCHQKILRRPLLYLSHYLRTNRAEYYDRLTAIRTDGRWEDWLKFFLRGVYEVSTQATATAREILELRERHRGMLYDRPRRSTRRFILLDKLFQHPIMDIGTVQRLVGGTYDTASSLVAEFETLQILQEMTGGRRNRLYRYEPYLALFERTDPEQTGDASLRQRTRRTR